MKSTAGRTFLFSLLLFGALAALTPRGSQTAPASTGTFTNLPGATSPYTNPLTAAQQFFRLKKN